MSNSTGDKLAENIKDYIQMHERQEALYKEIIDVCLKLLTHGGDIHTRKRVIELLQTIKGERNE